MALVGNLIPSKNTVYYEFPACYARVTSVNSENASGGLSFVNVEFYANHEARQVNAAVVSSKTYNTPTVDLPPSSDPIERGYLYIKTLPDFAGWIDV